MEELNNEEGNPLPTISPIRSSRLHFLTEEQRKLLVESIQADLDAGSDNEDVLQAYRILLRALGVEE